MFAVTDHLKNVSLRSRDTRLKAAKKQSEICARDLKKDRTTLERKEKQMMADLKMFIKRGDIPKAKMLASQVANYRNISDKNYARSIYIETETQKRVSNHKISQAHVEFLKGMNFANFGETAKDAKNREQKYLTRLMDQEAMEEMFHHGFEEEFEERADNQELPAYFDNQVNAIFKEAFDKQLNQRDYGLPKHDTLRDLMNAHLRLFIRVYDDKVGDVPGLEAAVAIPTIEISVDMLKRFIQRDGHIMKQLKLQQSALSKLKLGSVTIDSLEENEKGTFCAFEPRVSLKSLGLADNNTVWIYRD